VSFFPYVVAAWVFLAGLYGIVTSRHLVHLIVCVSVVQSATYVLLIAIGYRMGSGAPIFIDAAPWHHPSVDPIVQALSLTDIVVSAATTALLLAIATQVRRVMGETDPDKLRSRKG
jgi:multicomponent Na+:H+ antiporter subunit C